MATPPEPPITPELRAEARRRPGAMLYSVDRAFDPEGEVPPYGVVGCWQVDHHGAIARFIHNPNYRPSPISMGWAQPQNAVEAALQAAATGYGTEDDLLTALLDAPLLLFAQPGPSNLYTLPGEGSRYVLEACTSPQYLPQHWPGSVRMTGRQIAELTTGLDLRLNPRSVPSVTVPVEDLERLSAEPPRG